MFKNLLVPFVFALAVAHTACADPGDTCSGSGPIEISSSCSKYNCFDGAHINGYDITCVVGVSEAECAEKCCSQADCKGFDFSASDHGMGAGRCCTGYVSRVKGGFQQNGGTYRSCEKNGVTCHIPAACREFGYPKDGWQVDEDCCAPYYQSACADGYDHMVTEHKCFQYGDCVAYSTICTPSDDPETVTMSNDVENYKCEQDKDAAIVFIFLAVLVPLLVMCCVSRCYLTKTGCFRYRRTEQSSGIAVAQGVQMGYMPTVYAQPAYGWPHYAGPPQHGGQPQYGQPAPPPGYTVHQATVQPTQMPYAQPSAQPYTGQGSQDPGIVRYGQQSKVPTV
jgi:hypothetical protein|tara:strand:+ start:1569 stop:2579 length:1011 start_codon:yes stop_codon:yes gene_type:complete